MLFRQILRNASGCASYLLGCTRSNQAAIIDPLAELGAAHYALEAAELGLSISYIIDTHIHADHRSAAQELAHYTQATLMLPAGSPVDYDYSALEHGQEIQIGGIKLQVLHTPGHTPESICLLVTDTARSDEPWFLLSGDTLFAGDVGRPDLQLDQAKAKANTQNQAQQLYHSLFGTLMPLNDTIEIYPGHFGGSTCGGVNMSGKPSSTIGFERRYNLVLQHQEQNDFIDFVMRSLKEQPEHYQEIKRSNLRQWQAQTQSHPLQLSAQQIQQHHDALILDLRSLNDFIEAHISGAVNQAYHRYDLAKNLGKLLPSDRRIIIVADNDLVAQQASQQLQQADWNIAGYLAGGQQAWHKHTSNIDLMEIDELAEHYSDPDLCVVDVREPHEWQQGVIAGAQLIPQGQLWAEHQRLPHNQQIVTICAGGVRSARAAGVLKHLGFPQVASVKHKGMLEWQKRGYPTVQPA